MSGGSTNGYLDPNIFRDNKNNTFYLVYTYDDFDTSGNAIYFVKLDSPTQLSKDKPKLLMSNNVADGWINSHPDNVLTWEGNQILEQPFLFKMNGFYYLFYNANYGSLASYGVGVLRSKSLSETFVKIPQTLDQPLLGNSSENVVGPNSIYGPGSVSILEDSLGGHIALYRQKKSATDTWSDRAVTMDKVTFNGDGTLSVQASFNHSRPAPVTKKIIQDCKKQNNQTFYSSVQLTWTNPSGVSNAYFSMDFIDSQNKTISACRNSASLQQQRSISFSGDCESQNRLYSLDPSMKVRICAAQNDVWGSSGIVQCTEYKSINAATISFTFK